MKQSIIYLAGGCFWGTEHFLKLINGVVSTEVGYLNSRVEYPTYKEVCTGQTNAAEGVRVVYDSDEIALSFILELYYKTIDPTSLNKQGGDTGTQYRTGIYYVEQADKTIIENSIAELTLKVGQELAIEVGLLENYYPAEAYHQDYLEHNPAGYCHIDPSLFEMARAAKKSRS